MSNSRLLQKTFRLFGWCAIFLLLLLCIPMSLVFAQKSHLPLSSAAQTSLFHFDHFSIEQGLSQSSGHCILQDRRGFMWIGTQDGVNKYDGYTFTVYRHIPSDSTSLSDSWITGFYEDRTGQFWLTTRNGVNLFDAAKEQFSRLRIPYVTAVCSDARQNVYFATIQGVYAYSHATSHVSILTNEAVQAFALDSSNNLIIAGKRGLMRLLKENASAQNIPITDARIKNSPIRALATLADGTLLVMTSSIVARLNAASGEVLQSIPLRAAHLPINSEQSVYTIHPQRNGSVCLSSGAAVTQWNPQTQQIQTFAAPPMMKSASSPEQINVSVLYNDTTLWVGTNLGAWCISLSANNVTRIEPDPTENTSLNEAQVLSICIDRTSTLWLGTRTGGVNTWNPRRYKFALTRRNPFKSNSLSSDGIRAFYEEGKGLWVGTEKGLNFFDKARNTWTQYVPEKGNPFSIVHEYVTSLVDDGQGTLWCGTRFGGVSALDKAKKKFRSFRPNQNDSTALSHENIFAMCLSKYGSNAGKIWIATQGGGLNLLNPKTSTFRQFRRRDHDSTTFVTDSIRSVFEDKQGRVWVGSSGYGLMLFSAEKGVLARFANKSTDTTSLSNNTVTNIYEDSRGNLWIATAAGLNQFIPEKQAFERFTTKDGLPNAYVYGICEDEEGNLWVSTNNGLCCFNPNKRTFRSFDVFDGLQSNEFNTGAFYRSPISGMMYFGGVHGFNSFQPREVLAYQPTELPIVLIAFKVNGVQRAFTQPLAEIREIALDHNENEISFEFVALDFLGAAKIRYEYLLEGFDKHWSEEGARRYAAYTNLESGTYRFRVRASNVNKGKENAGTSILITIRPPFWERWWFRMVAAICVVGGLWSGFRWRIRNIKRHNEILEQQVEQRTEQLTGANYEIQRQNVQLHDQNLALELAIQELAALNKEKNEFLGIAAHDLKNPLTGIMLSANMITTYRNKLTEHDLSDMVKKIYLSAERMFAIITNLLDINAIDSGKFNFTLSTVRLDTALEAVVQDYRARAGAKEITLYFECNYPEGASMLALVDNAAMTEILENLVSNAVKYSPLGKRVWARVLAGSPEDIAESMCLHGIPITQEIPAHSIIACIQDEGHGIAAAEKHQLFGRFVKLSTRPTAGENSTGLGLSIVKKMAEAMNGKVWCESEEGKGASFLVALPIAPPETH
jgi:signal transduction histidine kinase/ligand-binding sensor domain-containing protein